MAKNKNLDFEAMFGNFDRTKKKSDAPAVDSRPQVETPVQAVPPSVPASSVAGVNEEQVLQGKQAKKGSTQKKEYNYGTKRTFPIHDDLWGDALIVMQAKGMTQVEWINNLIRSEVEANRETIIAVKKMRGEI